MISKDKQGTAQTIGDDSVSAGLLRIPEAAAFLGISRAKLYSLMDQGRIVFLKTDRCRRVPKKALTDFARDLLRGGK